MATKTYEIFKNSTNEIVETVSCDWEEVKKKIAEFGGVTARVVININPINVKIDAGVVYVDAWTSGNPGIGGFRVVHRGLTVINKNSKEPHTNNFFEIAAIWMGLKYLSEQKIENGVVFTDSQTAISWIKNGKFETQRDVDIIEKLIVSCKKFLNEGYKVEKWNTRLQGEIPADFGRK